MFVQEYAPMIIELLEKELDPKEVCTALKLCKANQTMAITKPEVSQFPR